MTNTNDPIIDIAVIGAGIAGVSVAYFASPHASVLLLEREAQPSMHSTGRSAAMFMESYGSAQVRALTRASRAFLESPPPGFCTTPLIAPRGALYIGTPAQMDEVRTLHATLLAEGCPALLLTQTEALALVPVLRPDQLGLAVLDPAAADVDVHALHQGFLRGARANGAQLVCHAGIDRLSRDDAGVWSIGAGTQHWRARQVVNAAGAWVDEVAGLAGAALLGIQPRRRSAFVFDPPADVPIASWPCVAAVDEAMYFKPDAGLLLGSPANADPVVPHDVVPEELDIATGIAHIEALTTLTIRRPRRTWAGLRSFAPHGDLVGGFDPLVPGFFWMAGLGGYGIQTSPAFGSACAALLLGQPVPPALTAEGLDAAQLALTRAATST